MAEQAIEFKLKYDATADVLYCSLGEPREAISEENEEGVIIRKDPETHQMVGMTVIDFAKRFAERPDSSLSFPFNPGVLSGTHA